MSDCGFFESKYKDLTPNSKPEEAQPLLEAMKEVNQMRLLNSDTQKTGEKMAQGLTRTGLPIEEWTTDQGTAKVVARNGFARAIEVKHPDGGSEVMHYDPGDQPKATDDTVTIACSGGAPIRSTFELDQKGKVTKDEILLPNNIQIDVDPNGKPTAIKHWFGK